MNRLLRRTSPPGVGQARNDGAPGGYKGMDWRRSRQSIPLSPRQEPRHCDEMEVTDSLTLCNIMNDRSNLLEICSNHQ